MGNAIFNPPYDDVRRVHFTIWWNSKTNIAPCLNVQFKCYVSCIEFPVHMEFPIIV